MGVTKFFLCVIQEVLEHQYCTEELDTNLSGHLTSLCCLKVKKEAVLIPAALRTWIKLNKFSLHDRVQSEGILQHLICPSLLYNEIILYLSQISP